MSKETAGQFSALNIFDMDALRAQAKARKNILEHTKLVLVGPFRAMDEADFAQLIESKGGRVHKKVGSQTTGVLVGARLGERREVSRQERMRTRAKQAGLAVHTEHEVLGWLGRDLPLEHDAATRVAWVQNPATSVFAVLRLAAKLHGDAHLSAPLAQALAARLGDWRVLGSVWDLVERAQWGAAWSALQRVEAPVALTFYRLCTLNDPAGLDRASKWRLGVFCLQSVMPSQWRRWLLDEAKVSGRSCPSAVSMLADLAIGGEMQAVEMAWREVCRGSEGPHAVQEGRAAAVYSDADLPALQNVLSDLTQRAILAARVSSDGQTLLSFGQMPKLPALKP